MARRDTGFGCPRAQTLLFALLLGAPAALLAGDTEGFANDREAAVHFLRPMFPIMDCEGVGVISKGEVDEHFFELFYALTERGSFSIARDEVERSIPNSNDAQLEHIFGMMDINGNGIVSTEEFRNFMFTALDLADSEQKGEVTLADVGLEAPRIIRAQDR